MVQAESTRDQSLEEIRRSHEAATKALLEPLTKHLATAMLDGTNPAAATLSMVAVCGQVCSIVIPLIARPGCEEQIRAMLTEGFSKGLNAMPDDD